MVELKKLKSGDVVMHNSKNVLPSNFVNTNSKFQNFKIMVRIFKFSKVENLKIIIQPLKTSKCRPNVEAHDKL